MPLFPKIITGNERYPALTGIRAVGATAVFLDHFPLIAGTTVIINVMAFFYVLSGFLIVRIYYGQLKITGHWLRSYFINRFARIYPVYFLLLTVAVFLRHDFRPWLLLKNYTLTHALFNNSPDYIIQPSWSLTVEECFYFLAPFFMLLIKRTGFFASLLSGFIFLGFALLISMTGFHFLETPLFIFSTTFFGHFLEFSAGIFLALVIMRVETKGGLGRRGLAWTVGGIVGVGVLVVCMIVVYRHPPLDHSLIILINNFLIPIPIAALYFGLLSERTLLSRFLSVRLMGILGRASYSFYLLHTIIIGYVSLPLLQQHFNGWRPLCVLLTFIVTWLISIALFAIFEEPINLFIRKKYKSKNKTVGITDTVYQQHQQKAVH
jgi:peptidoglycan/LPS O-acetylase OafA/YrhL